MPCYYVDRSDLQGQRFGDVFVTKHGDTATICRDQRFEPSLIRCGRDALIRLHEGATACSCQTGETVVRIMKLYVDASTVVAPGKVFRCAKDEPVRSGISSLLDEEGKCLFLPAGFPVVACKNQCTPGEVRCHYVCHSLRTRTEQHSHACSCGNCSFRFAVEEYPADIEGGCTCAEVDPEALKSSECCIS